MIYEAACVALMCGWMAGAQGENLVRNGGFEQVADGAPVGWKAAGDARLVEQSLASDTGREKGRSAKLQCRRFRGGSGSAHAMVYQLGVPVRRGKVYRVSFWARARSIRDGSVSVALQDTTSWAGCGLRSQFAPLKTWTPHAFFFTATRDCGETSRLQFWFESTGTLWLDDVRFEPFEGPIHRPGVVFPRTSGNLVPNGSFECGASGWGSEAREPPSHWGGGLNRLFGAVDRRAACHGHASLRISVSADRPLISYFDYFDPRADRVESPLAARHGWMEVVPGRPHTFSAAMKASADQTPALLAVREFDGRLSEKRLRLSGEWTRASLTFSPQSRWCYVLAGPDLRGTEEPAGSSRSGTVWIDALQLEAGDSATAYRARSPLELGVETDELGNVFSWEAPLRFRVRLAATEAMAAGAGPLEVVITDYRDEKVWERSQAVHVTPGMTTVRELAIPPSPRLRGFLRVRARVAVGDAAAEDEVRAAAIPIYRGEDSRFGVNHAYPWPHLLKLCRKAGIVWVRDWSCKWHDIEPEPGRFTFEEVDPQIRRCLEEDLNVLGLLPFPSSDWASRGPALDEPDGYRARLKTIAHAPKRVAPFQEYVRRTVAHFKDDVRWWQVFNEPLFTHYSLPRGGGYTGEDYARWVKAFARAARQADPDCRILAGIGGLSDGITNEHFAAFFAAGGLEEIDAVDIHHYPGLRPPEAVAPTLTRLVELMARQGPRKPLWLTEYGYYADDDPTHLPIPHSGFNTPLPSEKVQVDYVARWTVLMLAGGVDKLFYHAGTCDSVNRDSLQGVFFEYGGTPHKVYAGQAVLAHLFRPSCRFVESLDWGDGVHAHLFRDGRRLVLAAWSIADEPSAELRFADPRIAPWDVMGRVLTQRPLRLSGSPVYLRAEDLSDEQFLEAISLAQRQGQGKTATGAPAER